MNVQPIHRIGTLHPTHAGAPTYSRVEVSDAECVGWLGADAADPDDWQFFYEGDADPDDYEIVRPVYAPVADDSTTNKETP